MHAAPTDPTTHKRAAAPRTMTIIVAITLVAATLITAPAASAQQNEPPIANAGEDKTFPIVTTRRTLQGTNSFDIGGLSLTFAWSVVTPAYNWLTVIPEGSPPGIQATFLAPSATEVAQYGNTITFRLTVTNTAGLSATDDVIFTFEGPPTVSIGVAAHLLNPNPTDIDGDGFIEDDERYNIDAVIARPGQGGNSNIEWDIKEGARLTLTATATPAAGTTGTPRYRYFWQKNHAVPNLSQFNISSGHYAQTAHVLLPDNTSGTRVYIAHYRLTVTTPSGLQVNSIVRINVVDQPIVPTVELTLANTSQPVQDANALDPDAATPRYVVGPGAPVQLLATGADSDLNQTRDLVHTWAGTGVEPSPANPAKGAVSRATFTAPANAPQGQTVTVTVTVADTTDRVGQDEITFVVANNTPPVATAPPDQTAEDGPRGGTDNAGTVILTGTGADADGDQLSYRWAQVDAQGKPLSRPTVTLLNADTATVSFTAPQLSANGVRQIHLAFTAIDTWGVGHTDTTTVTVLGRNERPIADAGEDRTVAPGTQVLLDGTKTIDPDPGTTLKWKWKYTELATTPPLSQRPLTGFDKLDLAGFIPTGTKLDDYSGLNPFRNQLDTLPKAAFTAPKLGSYTSVSLTFTLIATDHGGTSDADTVTITVIGPFFSGTIDGPDFCTTLSLGGPRTYAFDSDGDKVADICVLPYTRREAVARQNALAQRASLDEEGYRAQVLAACVRLTGDYGDSATDTAADACATRRVTDPPPPVDPVLAPVFFSGVIDGPDFCINLSLGGPRTYAFDSDADGIADVCSLPYTRREAVARQNALDTFTTPKAAFDTALALACRDLGAADFGDRPADLAVDACS